MNTTVGNRQILEGLKAFIQSVVTLTNSKGEIVPVPVRVRKADEDFKKEDYPMIIIHSVYMSKRDEIRYSPSKVLISKNPELHTGVLERSAVPYTITYQIDFYSILLSDMDEMIRKWQFEAGRHFNLPVVDNGGTTRYANAFQTGDTLRRNDRLSDNNRIFNSTLTYNVWAELDEENPNKLEECNIVTEVKINSKSFIGG